MIYKATFKILILKSFYPEFNEGDIDRQALAWMVENEHLIPGKVLEYKLEEISPWRG